MGRILTFYGFIKFEVVVKSQNSDVPPGRGHCRHRYRELIDCLFDPDTDSGPGADKAEKVLFEVIKGYSFEIIVHIGEKSNRS